MGTAGQDFDDYRRWLEAAGVDTTLVSDVRDKFTASFFCSTDVEGIRCVVLHRRHEMPPSCRSGRSTIELAIISPNDPAAMIQYAEECRTLRIPYIWDPGQQCARAWAAMSFARAWWVPRSACATTTSWSSCGRRPAWEKRNPRERRRPGGDQRRAGMHVFADGAQVDVPLVAPARIVDPTGVGDAFRGGFLKGMSQGSMRRPRRGSAPWRRPTLWNIWRSGTHIRGRSSDRYVTTLGPIRGWSE